MNAELNKETEQLFPKNTLAASIIFAAHTCYTYVLFSEMIQLCIFIIINYITLKCLIMKPSQNYIIDKNCVTKEMLHFFIYN